MHSVESSVRVEVQHQCRRERQTPDPEVPERAREQIHSSSRSTIRGKKPLNGAQESGEHVAAFEVVLRSQHVNLPGRTVDVDHTDFGFHQPDQAGSGGEVIVDLDVDVGDGSNVSIGRNRSDLLPVQGIRSD